MVIEYRNKNIGKICSDYSYAKKIHGEKMADKIHARIDQIRASESAEEMVKHKIGRCHQLKGDKDGKYAVDLVHPYRLVFFRKIGNWRNCLY